MTFQDEGAWARRASGEFMLDVVRISKESDTSDRHFCYFITVYIEHVVADVATGVDDFGVVVMSPTWLASGWDRLRSYFEDDEPTPILALSAVWFQETWDLEVVLKYIDALCVAVSPAPDFHVLNERLARSLDSFLGYVSDARINREEGLPPPGSPPPSTARTDEGQD